MNPKLIVYFVLMCFCLVTGSGSVLAQTSKTDSLELIRQKQQEARERERATRDSLREVQQQMLEARREALQRTLDSTREARARIFDSIQEVRARRADSLQAIREYKASRYYRDSVKYAREDRIKAIQEARKRMLDSIKAIRKKSLDSAIAARKKVTDSIRFIQKRRSDSLAARRKYKESKRYADSVIVVKKLKLDSLQRKRKKFNDSLIARRKKNTDSLTRMRKVRTDSLTVKRKVKTDSLTKVKEKKEKLKKDRIDAQEKKQQLAFELKIKKRHLAYSNEKMLKKRWTWPRQFVQNNFTRYNYYYNISRKMEEAKLNMLRGRKDNYDSLLALYPFNPDKDSSLLARDMDSLIQKASVGIQIHDPRTKWGDDLYLLLGQAYFYKGNYSEAAASFRYILSLRDKRSKDYLKSSSNSKPKKTLSIAEANKKSMLDFLKHRSVHNESILWLAHTYTQMRQEGNAESVLDLVASDPNFPKELKGRLALEKAFIALHENDFKTTADNLSIVMKDDNIEDWQRMRAGYIAGQIYQKRSEDVAAEKCYQQVLDLNPKLEMDFNARKNLAFCQINTNAGQDEALTSFKKVLNDSKYLSYYEQVYYIMGRLAANAGKNDEALSYYKKGLTSAKVTPKQKVQTFAAMGNVYYNKAMYVEAKLAYDSAALLASHAPKDSTVILAVKRGQKLNGITEPVRVIHDNDSLMALSRLTNKEQLVVVRKYIKRLEQAKTDSAYNAENATLNAQRQVTTKANSSSPYANWYFANPTLVQQGVNEFKRKWGNRQPADNWARSSAVSNFANKDNPNDKQIDTSESDVEYDANGLPTEESLLAFIPSTDEKRVELSDNTQRAYLDLATAYINDFEEYIAAVRTLDSFDKRFPATDYEVESWYLRYLAYAKQSKLDDARVYAIKIREKYPESKFATLVGGTSNKESEIDNNVSVAQYYDETYQLLLNRDNATVLARVKLAERQYNDPGYHKRFWIVQGIALAGVDSFIMADSVVRDFITKYPTDSLRPWADAVLKHIADKLPKPVAASPVSGAPATSPTAITSANPSAPPPPLPNASANNAPAMDVEYTFDAKDEQYVMFTFASMEQRVKTIRDAFDDFNNTHFASLKLSAEITLINGMEGVVLAKAFSKMNEARIYLNALRSNSQVFKDYKPGEYQLVLISPSNYGKLLRSKDIKAYLRFYNTNYK